MNITYRLRGIIPVVHLTYLCYISYIIVISIISYIVLPTYISRDVPIKLGVLVLMDYHEECVFSVFLRTDYYVN